MSDGKPEVFILESLQQNEEDENLFEGKIIQQILALSGKQPDYVYFSTKDELVAALEVFSHSGHRYLHVSCHGDGKSQTVTFKSETVSISEFAAVLHPHLRHRRLFFSACDVTTERLAKRLLPSSGCYSVIGPTGKINIHDATILWSSLYHCLFAANWSAIKRKVLKAQAQEVANLFRVPLRLFVQSSSRAKGYEGLRVRPDRGRDAASRK